MLPIQRKLESGAYVPCWKTVGVVPLGSRSSYQRTPVLVVFAVTVWFVTRDSWLPKFRYASRNIMRSPSVSSVSEVAPVGIGSTMQVPPVSPHGWVKSATLMSVGPVKEVFVGVAQSTWNFHSCSRAGCSLKPTMKFGWPDDGAIEPSRSLGSRPEKLGSGVVHSCVAVSPASIFVRSKAQTSTPT